MEWRYTEDKKRVCLPDGKPKRLKKITGTRFAAILGLNPWTSPFQAWCEITGAAKIPFEDNEYTIAGKVIEPKVIDYCKNYFMPDEPLRVASPTEHFGALYPKMKYDFYPTTKRFGGMWDAKILRKDLKTASALIEIKTTKRVEDWTDNPPIYYLLQLMLYAYLEGVNTVYLTASFLQTMDYAKPELFVPTAENTIILPYRVSDFSVTLNGVDYKIEELVQMANDWYDQHIETGVSPEFDEAKDFEILKELRHTKPENDFNLDDMIDLANNLEDKIAQIKEQFNLDGLEKQLKLLKDGIKVSLMDTLKESDKTVTYQNYKLTKGETKKINNDMLKIDGLYDKYLITEPKYTLTKTKTKGE